MGPHRNFCASMLATVPKVQHEPHWPWSFTGPTALESRQSTFGLALRISRAAASVAFERGRARWGFPLNPSMVRSKSLAHMSEYLFSPCSTCSVVIALALTAFSSQHALADLRVASSA